MVTKIKNLRIREEVWQKFKAQCALEKITLGKKIGDLMIKYLDKIRSGINPSSNNNTTPESDFLLEQDKKTKKR